MHHRSIWELHRCRSTVECTSNAPSTGPAPRNIDLICFFLLFPFQLNGINTQGENIADNGGIKEAYLAYHKWVKRNGPEQKLPGLKYTPTQLFWISGAQQWCAVSRANYKKIKITTGVHSPNEFRVTGPLSNTRDFSFDFNCPEGTRMNPVKKCEVW